MTMHPNQADFFGYPAASASPTPDPAVIRRRLHAMLAQIDGAADLPWNPQETRVNVLLMRQMSNWLPADERAALCDVFFRELQRLRVAVPAQHEPLR